METLKWEVVRRLSSAFPSIIEVAYSAKDAVREIQEWFLENHGVGIDNVWFKFSVDNQNGVAILVAIGYYSAS